MTRICLTMIVKNEAHVIRRCLESARDWIDYWVIVDTGSTDGTQDVIREVMAEADVRGELHERPWVNFAHNRNEVLDYAQLSRDPEPDGTDWYAVWIDADEVFTTPPIKGGLTLTQDGYFVQVAYDGISYARLAVTRMDREWRWVGPVHETLELEGAVSGNLKHPGVLVRHDGARSKDPETYRNDADLLEKAVGNDLSNTRLRFYYAQSLRDAGELLAARDNYRKRTEMGGWNQEVFISWMEIGRISERLGEPAAEAYLSAYDICPDRAEPLVALACLERVKGRFAIALLYASGAVEQRVPKDGLFVDMSCYKWRAWDEYALAAWYTGNPEEARDAAAKALFANPDDQRLLDNLRLCGG